MQRVRFDVTLTHAFPGTGHLLLQHRSELRIITPNARPSRPPGQSAHMSPIPDRPAHFCLRSTSYLFSRARPRPFRLALGCRHRPAHFNVDRTLVFCAFHLPSICSQHSHSLIPSDLTATLALSTLPCFADCIMRRRTRHVCLIHPARLTNQTTLSLMAASLLNNILAVLSSHVVSSHLTILGTRC